MDTQPACMQLDRTNKTKSRKVSQICIFIGINNCFAPHFDVNVSSASHEKLIYPVNHKFCPDFISLCFLTSFAVFRNDSIGNAKSFNTKVKVFAENINDIPNSIISVVDFITDYSKNPSLLSSDGLQPSED